MKPKRKRWVCPDCGDGVLLSSRPRKNATGRYCLRCSAKRGTLVERVCPILERARATSAIRSAEKAKVRVERQREKESRAGIHVPTEYRRVWQIARKLNNRIRSCKKPPRLTLRERTWAFSGRAYEWGHRIVLSFSRECSPGRIREVICHEIAHIAAGCDENHGDGFWVVLCELAETAYPGTTIPVLRGDFYDKGQQIADALDAWKEES